ncbi:MAG: thymidine phosphorylase [Armatimonadota bacterium]|nr:thymidine phosphorylase [Armatimonadota bacterium]
MSYDIRRLSERKRRGEALGGDEIRWVVEAYTSGEIDDAPMAAWLMAVCCGGMTDQETWHLTDAMARSGEMLDLSGMPRPTADKHSTGGVGDKVTLVAAPVAAACGACVAKMSGRGLGHTGGTIDKLEAIPGLRTEIAPDEFLAQAEAIGLVVAAQSSRLAPADGRMYALRDATGTVDSPALIASSIMSKKIAAGAEVIVLDVTVGSGAFMQSLDEARALAELMVALGQRAGRRVAALLTDMEAPLGRAVGNAVEVEEAVAVLRGEGPADVQEVSVAVASRMLALSGVCADIARGRSAAVEAIDSGMALDKLREMIQAQGGDAEALARPMLGHEPMARETLRASRAGVISRIDARGVGYAALAAGAGRRRKRDELDPGAGLRLLRVEGDRVSAGEVLAEVMASSGERVDEAVAELRAAIEIGDGSPEERPLVIDSIPPEVAR